jgi:hypothetical protein
VLEIGRFDALDGEFLGLREAWRDFAGSQWIQCR